MRWTRAPSRRFLSEQTSTVLVPEKQQQQLQGMQRGVDEGGVLVVGKKRILPPGIEHLLEADAKMMEYIASARVYGRNCRMRNDPELPKLGARKRMRTLMWTRSWGWGNHLFPARSTKETPGGML